MNAGRRVAPVQKRSRERMERILEAAAARIAEVGSDAMTMSEVAQRCDISIGSLYQYFRHKGAILGALAERYHEATRACIAEKLDNATTVGQFEQGFADLIDAYFELFLAEPVIRDVWSGVAADRALQDMETVNSRENGRLVARHLLRLAPEAEPEVVLGACFLVMALGEATMRLAITLPDEEGPAVVQTYRGMALAELRRSIGAHAVSKVNRLPTVDGSRPNAHGASYKHRRD